MAEIIVLVFTAALIVLILFVAYSVGFENGVERMKEVTRHIDKRHG